MGAGRARFELGEVGVGPSTPIRAVTWFTSWPTPAGRWARDCQSVRERSRCESSSNTGLWVCRTRLRPITLVTYARDVRRLTAVLGDIPLRNLTPGLIQSAYNALLDQGFSKRTVEKTHAVLHRAMDQAMHWGLTARNPTELVSPPRPVRREMTALTGSQFGQLLRVTEGSRWYPLWVLLGTSGLRVGEALGLLWKDVDLDAGRLAVRHTLQRQPGRGFVLGPPKTEKSRRTVYLSGFARKALEQQRERQYRAQRISRRWVETGLVFTNQNGEAVGPGGGNRALDEALQSAGLPHVRVHDLRHTTGAGNRIADEQRTGRF